jgi:hypothetical protein
LLDRGLSLSLFIFIPPIDPMPPIFPVLYEWEDWKKGGMKMKREREIIPDYFQRNSSLWITPSSNERRP